LLVAAAVPWRSRDIPRRAYGAARARAPQARVRAEPTALAMRSAGTGIVTTPCVAEPPPLRVTNVRPPVDPRGPAHRLEVVEESNGNTILAPGRRAQRAPTWRCARGGRRVGVDLGLDLDPERLAIGSPPSRSRAHRAMSPGPATATSRSRSRPTRKSFARGS